MLSEKAKGGLSFSFSQPHRQGEPMWYPLTPTTKKIKKIFLKNLEKNLEKIIKCTSTKNFTTTI